ncbi:isochorismate synthase [Rhodocyclus tenuis]|uniref:isochorismate synthase n=1 Tax=Rhodocyclus tenuis TaxID=1066 RepID=UPI0019039E47|nr:isochorismate synthase [Rhodocyclus tenuis]MBK1679110.1 hypothetical protein [Rhodocyclus tenuis]
MSLPQLLDVAQRGELRRRLGARLSPLLAGVPAHGAISITLDLGYGRCDWLDTDFTSAQAFWWARPESDEWRLALGQALIVASAGPNRFPALRAAYAGLTADWLHCDADATGLQPAAHLGFAFDDEEQEQLPNARLVVPAVLLVSRHGRLSATFSCSGRDSEAAVDGWVHELSALGRSRHGKRAERSAGQQLLRQENPLADRAFIARVRAALAGIAAGRLQKLVISRSVRLEAQHAIAIAPVLAALAARHPACTLYAVSRPGFAFVGATPERLVALSAGIARADALAGTSWAARPAAEKTSDATTAPAAAAAPASLRLEDDKNSREQGHVVDAVRTALTPLCRRLTQSQTPEVLRLRDLQHLRTVFTGELTDDVGLFELIAALHPTPAVGGTPTHAARAWLRARRERRAAWYSGGVGWIDAAGDGEVVVALRCARIAGRHAACDAGAGIVAGSDPAQEFAETEVKLAAAIDALSHAEHATAPAADESAVRTGTQ